MRRSAAAAQQQPFEMRFIQFEELAGGEFVGKANGGFPQLTRRRETGFAVDMLQQLEADIAHIQHSLLQIAAAGIAELGAEVVAGGDDRLGAAETGEDPAEQMLAQRGIRRQRTVSFQYRAGGTVIVQQPQFDIFHQQAQAVIQCRLLLFRTAGDGQCAKLVQIAGF